MIHNTPQGQERHGRRSLPYLRQKFRCWAVLRLILNGISHTYIVRLIYIRSSYIAENSLVRAEVYLFSAIFVHTAHPLQTFFCFISCSVSVSLSPVGDKDRAYTNGITAAAKDSTPTASTKAIAMVFLFFVLFLRFVIIFGLGRPYTSFFKVIYHIIIHYRYYHHSSNRKK